MKSQAAVQIAARTLVIQEFEVPDSVGPREALLKMEGCGICGADYQHYTGTLRINYPVIPGHEPVGVIAKIGEEAKRAWRVTDGDRVAIEPFGACGVCSACLGGHYQFCVSRKDPLYGWDIVNDAPLRGGFAEYMLLHPNTIVHKVPRELSIEDAVLFNPLGAGFEWAYLVAGTTIGDSVLILGPGQRGLACVIAAAEAGAERIIVTGLTRDAKKLRLALELGATHVIDAEQEDVVASVREITGGIMADRVIDVSASSTRTVIDAMAAVRRRGTVVLAGLNGRKEVPGFVSDEIVYKALTIRGGFGVAAWAYEQAIRVVASHKYPLEKLHTHTFALEDVDRAMRVLGGEVEGESAIHITIVPR